MKINQKAFVIAWENQKLVRGAIKCAHVRQDYTNYEDFLQEGLLIYAQMLTEQADLPRKEVTKMSALEQQIFVQHLLLQKPVSQLASELKVSRVQLQRVKKSLLQNLRVILER